MLFVVSRLLSHNFSVILVTITLFFILILLYCLVGEFLKTVSLLEIVSSLNFIVKFY